MLVSGTEVTQCPLRWRHISDKHSMPTLYGDGFSSLIYRRLKVQGLFVFICRASVSAIFLNPRPIGGGSYLNTVEYNCQLKIGQSRENEAPGMNETSRSSVGMVVTGVVARCRELEVSSVGSSKISTEATTASAHRHMRARAGVAAGVCQWPNQHSQ